MYEREERESELGFGNRKGKKNKYFYCFTINVTRKETKTKIIYTLKKGNSR